MSCGIEPDEEGSAGVRLTARGSVATYTYRMDTDGRTHLNSVGWMKFLDGKNLRVGQAILITIRNTHRPGLKMMIVIDITFILLEDAYDDRYRVIWNGGSTT